MHHRSPATRVSHHRKLHKDRVNPGSSPFAQVPKCKQLSITQDSTLLFPFYICVKLDEEARRGIIQQPVHDYICIPTKEVPTEFTQRATGNSITIFEATFSASSRFKVCFLVSPIKDHIFLTIGFCLRSKEGVAINSFFSEARAYNLSPLSEHLFILHGD